MRGIRLRHLVFTGHNIEPAEVGFDDGLNIVYGASNTGKSFLSKAILFMLGVSKSLPETDEIAGYDAVWLGLTLPSERDVTLYRATQGGQFRLYEGLVSVAPPSGGVLLRQQHDSKRTDTVSHLLLDAMGLADKQIVRNGDGVKQALSIYLLSPYAVVSEENIIAERSPVFSSGSPAERPFEQNLFKLLVTGVDGSAAVTVPRMSERKAAKAAKLELVDEMIAQLDSELPAAPATAKDAQDHLDHLDEEAAGIADRLQKTQSKLDKLVTERRDATDRRRELQDRAGELDLTLQRFAKLQAVYSSDLQRLQSIEEGGYVLVSMAGMDCAICGAPPEAQRHNHASEEISMAQKAAAAEVRKIEREQRELAQTTASLEAEAAGLSRTLKRLAPEIETLDSEIQEARPHEAALRETYQGYVSARMEVTKVLDLFLRRDKLVARRAEIGAAPTKREGEALTAGPDSTTMFRFGETVKDVLTAWHFPNAEKAQFDEKTNDITIAGKRRGANGKGVRAILHAAFNVAVFVYCIENRLPHPGFLVLDTPLLTYREPLNSRHGELSEDESELKATSLAEHFYKHLASLKNEVQFIVIENTDPPVSIYDRARIETFTGLEGNGRFGLLARDKRA
jgi:peptidoglycan hydrolase CwlO-like protein